MALILMGEPMIFQMGQGIASEFLWLAFFINVDPYEQVN